MILIDCDEVNNDTIELEADNNACDLLIPQQQYIAFTKSKCYYEDDIKRFTERIGIHPGIVVGRLQHDGLIPWSWHNSLKSSLIWK